MRRLHIGHGDYAGDQGWLERAAKSKRKGPWLVPKSVLPGDELLIKVGNTFFATARICSLPTPRTDRDRRYNARIENVRLIKPPLSIDVIRERVPEWKWTKYPRSITTPSEPIAGKIRSLITDRRSRRGADVIDVKPEVLSDEELWQLAVLCAKPRLEPKLRLKTVRDRSQIIHRWVMRRAAGLCEGCGKRAPFVRVDGTPYLEPHHTMRVGDDGPDDPGTVIALCPTCHRRVHYAWDHDRYNRRLKSKLKHLERSRP